MKVIAITSASFLLLAFAGFSVSADTIKGDVILYGTLKYDVAHYPAPAPLPALLQAMIQATRNWFSDIIKQILGITSAELIKQINACVLALQNLVNSAVSELQEIVNQVPGENQRTLQIIIDCVLQGAMELLTPVQDQLKQIILYLPETDSQVHVQRDVVSDIVEAILGISLEELLTNINNLFTCFNQFLLETMDILNEIANSNEVPAETAAAIEDVINQLLFQAQHELLRPLLINLGQLPIEDPDYSFYYPASVGHRKRKPLYNIESTKCFPK